MLKFVESITSIKDVNDLSGIKQAVGFFTEGKEFNNSKWLYNIKTLNEQLKVITADFYEMDDECYVLEGDGIEKGTLVVIHQSVNNKNDRVLCGDNKNRDFDKYVFNIFPVINEKNSEKIIAAFNKAMTELESKKTEYQNILSSTTTQKKPESVEIIPQLSDDEFLLRVISSTNTDEEKAKQIKVFYSNKK
jgi:hypothetical protein